jgi:hypothetical protein
MDDEKYIVIRSISQKRWATRWRGERLNTKGTRDHEGRAEEEAFNATGRKRYEGKAGEMNAAWRTGFFVAALLRMTGEARGDCFVGLRPPRNDIGQSRRLPPPLPLGASGTCGFGRFAGLQ